MGTCGCAPPALLHILPSGVHRSDGRAASLALVDEVWADGEPTCSVCAVAIDATFFRCLPCDVIVCRRCVARETEIVECDCVTEMPVTGVQLAAIRASAHLAR